MIWPIKCSGTRWRKCIFIGLAFPASHPRCAYCYSFLEESVTVCHPVDNIPDFQPLLLLKDTILDSKKRNTRQQPYLSYLVGQKGHRPVQVKWMTAETLQSNFTHLVKKAGTLLALNREELGNQEKTHSFGNI